jgi:hypothetical protein
MSETLVQTTGSKTPFDINCLCLDRVVRRGSDFSALATPIHTKVIWF